MEIVAHAVAETVRAEERDELLEHGGALAVGDAVEVEEGGVGVRHVAGDGVGGRQLVLLIGPGLHSCVERRPGALRPTSRMLHRQVRHVGRERFVEPQIVPPAHGDEVTEPHVRHLVQDHFGPVEALNLRRWVAEDHPLREGDASDILHRAHVELGHEDLVVLVERVSVVEELREERQSLARDLEELVRVEERRDRLAAEHAQRRLAGVVRPCVLVALVRSRDEGEEVGRDARRLGEHVSRAAVVGFRRGHHGIVGRHFPFRRRGHSQVERSFDVWLVETGQQAVRVVGLEMGIEILLAVLRIGELMKPSADVVVFVGIGDLDAVLLGQQGAVEVQPVVLVLDFSVGAVDGERMNGLRGAIEEGALGRVLQREADADLPFVRRRTLGQAELERVGRVGDARGAFLSLDFTEYVACFARCCLGHDCSLRPSRLL